ncbi:MAG: Flp family type IVb pilin [Bdellovibrionales bacterium]|nr:Flp family type IVb pilin [Bdellovibrionales bacterium]
MPSFKSKKGQGMVEYMVIVAMMAVATMGIMRVLSQTTQGKFAKITQSLQGGTASIEVQVDKVDSNHFKKKDMSNFFMGSKSNRD